MKIGQGINFSQADLQNKKFNYWIGISLGNKYFTKERIKKYIEWAVLNTKDSVFVLVPDQIHAVNLEVLDRRNEKAAMRKALLLGDAKIAEIDEIVSFFPPELAGKIRVGRWEDVKKDELYQMRANILVEEFNKKKDFYRRVIEIVRDNFKNRPKSLSNEDSEKLASYVLNEMPVFLDGIYLFGNIYNAILYPGIGPIDFLEKDLQEGKVFPELTKRLEISVPAAIVEAFVE